ncbi:hypothetical protein YC2023_015832 [Brassica napus]
MPMVSRLESHRNCEQGRVWEFHSGSNNSNRDEGYFHIKIMEGVYEEYIVIEKKSYLMMSGAGINLTIITGNHSSVDGWGTSHLATFS